MIGKIITICIVLMIGLGAVSYVITSQTIERTTTGIVTNVTFSAGGFGHTDITAVYLNNGETIPLGGTYSFQIGGNYTFYYHPGFPDPTWKQNK